jgi:hypothetical protein
MRRRTRRYEAPLLVPWGDSWSRFVLVAVRTTLARVSVAVIPALVVVNKCRRRQERRVDALTTSPGITPHSAYLLRRRCSASPTLVGCALCVPAYTVSHC